MTRCAPRARLRLTAMGAGAALLALTACSSSGTDRGGTDRQVTVFAAASLKETFTKLGQAFEAEHPGTRVVLSFGGSDELAAGITNGAPADVFASASATTMRRVTDSGAAAGQPVTFARNRLEIATTPGNPDKIASLRDLTGSDVKVVLCDPRVPCGAAAVKALAAGGLRLTPVSYEQDVKAALNKVVLREADAALVYRTDVRAAGDKVAGVRFPESADAVNTYPVTVLKGSENPGGARAFIALVRSPEGRKVLSEAGFLQP